MSNVDLTTRVLQLSKENEDLRRLVEDFRGRFERLTPAGKRDAANFEAMLLLVMLDRGIECVTLTREQIAAMPDDRRLVFDGGHDGQSMRIRVMPSDAADAEVHPEWRN